MFNFNLDLTKDNILKSLVLFALPIFVSNVFQQLYSTIDVMIVGNILGNTSLAAIGSSSAVFELLIGFALGVGNGFSIVVARAYGSKDETRIKKSVAGSLIIGVGLTLLIMLIAHFGLYPLLELLDTPANIIDESMAYIRIIAMFVGVAFAYNLFAGLLRAIGNSVMPLVFLIFSSVLNVGLDLFFIRTLEMGIEGAAIATVISQGLSAVLCVIYIAKKAKILIPQKEHFEIDIELYKDLAGQGFSMGFMFSIVCTGTVILQKAINGFGYLVIAGHATARKINSFCMMPSATFAAALSTFVSQNRGANQKERIVKGVRTANLISLAWGAISVIIMLVFSSSFVEVISGTTEPVVVENATRYLIINAPFYSVLGILLNLRNALQGLGKKIVPLVSSIIEFLGKVVFAMVCIPSLGYLGVIICEPVIWCLMCLQLSFSYRKSIRDFKS